MKRPVAHSLTNYSFQFNTQPVKAALPPRPHRGAAAEARSGAPRRRVLLHGESTVHFSQVPRNRSRVFA